MDDRRPQFAEVVLTVPVKPLHYRIPPSLEKSIKIGTRVAVPLGSRKVTAFVVALPTSSDVKDIKSIAEVLDPLPLFSDVDLAFFRWVASYYWCSLSEVIKSALPSGINPKTDQHISITAAGRDALETDSLSPKEKELLLCLLGKKAVPGRSLVKNFQSRQIGSLISLLQRKEYIATEQKQSVQAVKSRKEGLYSVNEKTISQVSLSDWRRLRKKAPRQFILLKWLHHEKKATQRQIFSHWGEVRPTLAALEKKKLIIRSIREIFREPLVEKEDAPHLPPTLTPEQNCALDKILPAIEKGHYAPFLLHGITGSGKTEVYLRAVEAVLKTGRNAIVLVPEIALTPQLVARFHERFGTNIAQIHSGLSKGERYDEWKKIRAGKIRIVIGARSAIFAPLPSPGIVIVDEEHDSAYKQETKPCYNARDLALVKGKMNRAVVILGSATPMLETYQNSQTGKFSYLHLSQRVDNRSLPQVTVVDMRAEKPNTIISEPLKNALVDRWQRGEQSLLFLNRRGFAPFVLCRKCGYAFRCPNCDIALVYHQGKKILRCHCCNFSVSAPNLCPRCNQHAIEVFGFGTERLETEIRQLLPAVKVERVDKDTVTKKGSLQQIMRRFRRGEIELLLGTQMLAMGHDLPRVTLVGIVAADLSLNFPDFRAGERTFQLLTQVAGRSGRGEIPGTVFVQTFNPDHPSIKIAITQDFSAFYKDEILHRQELSFPPFSRLVNFLITGNSRSETRKYAMMLGTLTTDRWQSDAVLRKNVEVLGPAQAPWEKLKGRYRWQMLLKGRDHKVLQQFVATLTTTVKPSIHIPGVALRIDIDPLSML
ncbi:MAG: primosomal protein N' [Deltaproteobacteria bacterium]|nr:primosomal protein N' [Deltaproteobacteria bacterium]